MCRGSRPNGVTSVDLATYLEHHHAYLVVKKFRPNSNTRPPPGTVKRGPRDSRGRGGAREGRRSVPRSVRGQGRPPRVHPPSRRAVPKRGRSGTRKGRRGVPRSVRDKRSSTSNSFPLAAGRVAERKGWTRREAYDAVRMSVSFGAVVMRGIPWRLFDRRLTASQEAPRDERFGIAQHQVEHQAGAVGLGDARHRRKRRFAD